MAAKKKTSTKKSTSTKTTEKEPKNTKSRAYYWKEDLKKNPRKKWAYIIVALIVALGIFIYWKANYFVVATVNGEPISRYALIIELEKQGAQQVLEQMVTNKLVEQKAKEAGIVVTQEEIDAEVARVEESLIAQGADLEKMLSFYGQDMNTFLQGIKQNLIIKELFKDQIEISDSEIQEYYESNPDNFPEGATLIDLKDQIYDELYSNEVGMLYQEWLQEVKNESDINYLIYFSSENLAK